MLSLRRIGAQLRLLNELGDVLVLVKLGHIFVLVLGASMLASAAWCTKLYKLICA